MEDDLREEVAYLKARIADLSGEGDWANIRSVLGLTPQGARVLALLCARAGRVVRRSAIYAEVFERNDGDGPDERIMLAVICRLRTALSDLGAPDGLLTSWGVGYQATPDLAAWVYARARPQ